MFVAFVMYHDVMTVCIEYLEMHGSGNKSFYFQNLNLWLPLVLQHLAAVVSITAVL